MSASEQRRGSVRPTVAGARTGGRSARVVRDVLQAALQVLADRGYVGLSMEEVATRASVNKTTVYRRWPTKAELVSAALFSLRDEDPDPPDTGDIQADLFAVLKRQAADMATPRRRAIFHALLVGHQDSELQAVIRRLRRERPLIPLSLFERAVRRGQLPAATDSALLSEALLGPLHSRAYWKREPITDEYLKALIHLVISGAQAGPPS